MPLFLVLKTIHITTVLLTISGFIVRGVWMINDSPLLNMRAVKIFPHVNDTVLLFSALGTAYMLGQYPFVNGWLTAKVLGLVAYIVLGGIALTYGPTRKVRIYAYVGALLSFSYVVYVAFTKNYLLF